MKLSLLVVRCEDIEASRDFYEKLGLKFRREKHDSGPSHYSSEFDDMVFELYPSKSEVIEKTRLGFKVGNLRYVLSTIKVEAKYQLNGRTIYLVVDPDGRKIEVY